MWMVGLREARAGHFQTWVLPWCRPVAVAALMKVMRKESAGDGVRNGHGYVLL